MFACKVTDYHQDRQMFLKHTEVSQAIKHLRYFRTTINQ